MYGDEGASIYWEGGVLAGGVDFIFGAMTMCVNKATIVANINGETIQFSELDVEEGSFQFTFENNGRCTLILAGIENHGSYVFNKTSVDISYGGKTEKLLYDQGILTLNFYYNNETTSFMFSKQK